MSLRRRGLIFACLLVISGCASAVRVEPPAPEGEVARSCRALAAELPPHLDGRERRETVPKSTYVAVWGEPGIALRCGVPRPAALRPTDEVTEINGVAWFAEPGPDEPTLFTTTGRVAYVEVTIPREYEAAELLVDLSGPIGRTVSEGPTEDGAAPAE